MGERRKLENAAFVLPLFGALLLIPPLANVFNRDVMIFGVPLEVIYLFGVWTALIGITAFLSQRMGDDRPPERHGEDES